MNNSKNFVNPSFSYTKEQQQIMRHREGVGYVNAGAGTAKSTTLLATVNSLLQESTDTNVLVLTFNHHTLDDLRLRMGFSVPNVTITTFHAFGFDVIKSYWQQLGFISPNLKVVENAPNSRQYNKITYDDMLILTLELFQEKSILHKVASKYSYLLIDEVQDINKQQRQLVMKLFKHIKVGLLFGDLKQTIYHFRGADPKHTSIIKNKFVTNYYSLTQTFRVPKASMPFVNAHAASFNDDPSLTSNLKGNKPAIYSFDDTDEQSKFIADEIHQLISKGVDPKEIACLFRENQALLNLKQALEVRGVPVQTANEKQHIHWRRCLRSLILIVKWLKSDYQRKVPIHSVNRIIKITGCNINVDTIIKKGIDHLKIKKPKQAEKNFKSRLKKYRRLVSMREAIKRAATNDDAEIVVQTLIDALLKYVRGSDIKVKFVLPLLVEMKIKARNMSLDQVRSKELMPIINDNGVYLCTVHKAKSKEWQYVFLLHVVDEVFPNQKAFNSESENELFYTAITRHKKKLYLLQTPFVKIQYNNKNRVRRVVLGSESCFVTGNVKYLNDYRK
jgi:DNA helicase-2/ATP-dependent DNA helicase PcrA